MSPGAGTVRGVTIISPRVGGHTVNGTTVRHPIVIGPKLSINRVSGHIMNGHTLNRYIKWFHSEWSQFSGPTMICPTVC